MNFNEQPKAAVFYFSKIFIKGKTPLAQGGVFPIA